MRKLVAVTNMTLDGFCDHTAVNPDAEVHQHYTDLLNESGVALYGRVTYQLMQFWQSLVKEPSGNPSMDDFAKAIDRLPKIVFSHTLKHTDWDTARLASNNLELEVSLLKEQTGGSILVGSPGLIVSLTKLNLIDEYQICVHPVVAGAGLPLFREISEKFSLRLVSSKVFASGALLLTYEPLRRQEKS
jgi:dihydrofolate reductase